jgi:predicted ATPase
VLGYPDQALAAGRAALDLARESAHAPTVTEALAYLARLHQFRREPEQTRRHAEAAMQLAGEHGFAQRLAAVTILSGWALAAQGTPDGIASMARGVEAFRATGAADDLPYWLAILADRKAALQQFEAAWRDLDEATALARGNGILAWEAELHRLKGELLIRWDPARNNARASSAPADDAEGAFAAALAVSRRQQAKFFELRAAIGLARLLHDQGRRPEARDLLAPVYGWFTEGFATPDLREAKALLEELT